MTLRRRLSRDCLTYGNKNNTVVSEPTMVYANSVDNLPLQSKMRMEFPLHEEQKSKDDLHQNDDPSKEKPAPSNAKNFFTALPRKLRKMVYSYFDLPTAVAASIAFRECHAYFVENPFVIKTYDFDFPSWPILVRECVYSHMDLRSARLAAMNYGDVHRYLVRHPINCSMVFVDAEDRARTDIFFYISFHKNVMECHQREAKLNDSEQLSCRLYTDLKEIPEIGRDRVILFQHTPQYCPKQTFSGLQMTHLTRICIDFSTFLAITPRGVVPIRFPPEILDFTWFPTESGEVVAEDGTRKSTDGGVIRLTDDKIVEGVQDWMRFMNVKDKLGISLGNRFVRLPVAIFDLPEVKSTKTLAVGHTSEFHWACIVKISIEQVRALTQSHLFLGLTIDLSANEVVEYYMEKIRYWMQNPEADFRVCLSRASDDSTYDPDTYVSRLRLSPAQRRRFKIIPTSNGLLPLNYCNGKVLHDIEMKRALFIGHGPRVFTIFKQEYDAAPWEDVDSLEPGFVVPAFGDLGCPIQ